MSAGLTGLLTGKMALHGMTRAGFASCWRESRLFRVNLLAAGLVFAGVFFWFGRRGEAKEPADVVPGVALLVVVLLVGLPSRRRQAAARAEAYIAHE